MGQTHGLRRHTALLLFAPAILLLASCAAPHADLPYRPGTNGLLLLGYACPQALLGPVTLEADPTADPPVWSVSTETGDRTELEWNETMFAARWTPDLEIVSLWHVVAREGDTVWLGGGIMGATDNLFYVCSLSTEPL